MNARHGIIRSGFLVTTLVLLFACGSDSDEASTTAGESAGTDLKANLSEFEIELDADQVPSGEVRFSVSNVGSMVHEFVIFRTDLPLDALPVDDAGQVDEEGDGVTLIDEVENVQPESNLDLSVDLDPGRYVVICNLPGHYASGMAAELTVD